MKVCIFGAGAIGGVIGGHIARAEGVDVSLVARGPHLEAILNKGLRVLTPSDDFTVRVRATDNPAELGLQDYVFITLKSHQVQSVLDAVGPILGPSTAVIPPTTGIPYWYFYGQRGPFENRRLAKLDPGGRQWDVLGVERAIGCAYWSAAEVIEPGVILQESKETYFPVGEPDGSESERVTQLSKMMNAGGLSAPVCRDIRGEIWIKMINSLAWNPIAALCMVTNGGIADSPDVVAVLRRMMGEAEAVAAKLGITLPSPLEVRLASTASIRSHKMSMLQDLERRRPLEVDAIADSIETMRDLADLPTPTIDTVLALLKLRARTAFEPLTRASNTIRAVTTNPL
jgi:2-dehydropantoate 2-reductase